VSSDVVVLSVRDGEIEGAGSWVYAWLAREGVVYVGATGLHPATRTWLHLHDPDPNVGRVLARYPGATSDDLEVVALRVPDGADRQEVRRSATAVLAERGLLAVGYVGDAPGGSTTSPEAERLAAAVAERHTPVLRDVRIDDLDVLFTHWVDPEANRMAAFTAADPSDRDAFDARWRKLLGDETILARTIEAAGAVVGTIASWDNNGDREVTYWIGREHWGKGIATRALARFLELERTRPLHAAAAADNAGSIRVLEKCGFERTGGGRGFSNARGEEVDEVFLVLR
jgi:RimJ/RimL family protein N-acetyltransferase